MFISVLLPLPELPMIATRSPRSIRSETLRSARTRICPSSKILVTSCTLDDRVRAGDAVAPRRGATRCAPAGARAGTREARARGTRERRPAHQPPPLKKAAPPPREAAAAEAAAPPQPPPPRRLPSLEVRLLALESCAGGRQHDLFSGLQAAEDDRRAVAGQPRDHALAYLLAVAHDGHRVGGDRAGRDVDAFGLLDDDFGGRAHAGLQARFQLVELEGDVVADHPAVARGEQRDFADVSRELAAFERFDGDRRDLAVLDVADFRFAQRHHQLHRAEVAEDRERGGGARRSRRSSDELEEPVAERPAAEAPVAPVALDADPLEELPALEALVVPLPDTTSPTWPDSETIVPLSGA